MSKQTAVEWLACEIGGLDTGVSYHYFAKKVEEAKEMEKQQILFAYNDGAMGAFEKSYKGMHEYYEQNYGGNK
jgi:hypothetical protein